MDIPRQSRLAIPLGLMLLLAGCRHNRGPDSRPARANDISALPADAAFKVQHAGHGIFIAEDNGTLFIVNNRDRLVFSADMRINQRLIFLPEGNQILLDGQVVFQGQLNPDQTYRFYFSKGS